VSRAGTPWFRWRQDDLRIEVTVQAGARHDAANGIHNARLRLRIAAPAVDGKANRRLQDWLSAEFKVAKNRVRLLRGECSRLKSFLIVAPRELPAWFRDLGGGRA